MFQALEQFKKDYIWAHGYAGSTADNYVWAVNSFIRAVGSIKLESVTLEDIYTWREHMESWQYSVNVINCYLYRMRLLLRYYSKTRSLMIVPDDIVIPRKTTSLPKFLTKEELRRLLEACGLREKAIVAVLYSQGIRVGELCQIRRKDIQGDMVKIRGKGGKEALVILDSCAQHFLTEYLQTRTDSSPFLFYSMKHKGLGKSRVQKLVREAGEKAGLDKIVTPHVLRHSFATHMAQAGCGAFQLQGLMRHSHISTTQVYVHLTGQDNRQAYNRFHEPAFMVVPPPQQ